LELTVLNVFSGGGLAGVTVSGTGLASPSPSSASGVVTVTANNGGARDVTFVGSSVVTRTTSLKLPSDTVKVTLIPADFDLTAFDQLCRQPAIRRWQAQPTIAVETRVAKFTSQTDATLPASDVVETDATARDVALDMEGALSDLSGGRWTSFGAINVLHDGAAGGAIPVQVSGRITVTRVMGLYPATGFGGFTRWEVNGAGEVTGASILLDTMYDQPLSAYTKTLRMHELGHALGLSHVTVRPSVMNPSAAVGPTQFDRDATRLEWDRPLGNQSPDTDPSGASINRSGRSYWTAGEGSRPGGF
jgi:Matrixin